MLKTLRRFSGAKTEMYEFLLSGGKLPFAKILLEPAKPVLRIEIGGAAAPPNHPWAFALVQQPVFMPQKTPAAMDSRARFVL